MIFQRAGFIAFVSFLAFSSPTALAQSSSLVLIRNNSVTTLDPVTPPIAALFDSATGSLQGAQIPQAYAYTFYQDPFPAPSDGPLVFYQLTDPDQTVFFSKREGYLQLSSFRGRCRQVQADEIAITINTIPSLFVERQHARDLFGIPEYSGGVVCEDASGVLSVETLPVILASDHSVALLFLRDEADQPTAYIQSARPNVFEYYNVSGGGLRYDASNQIAPIYTALDGSGNSGTVGVGLATTTATCDEVGKQYHDCLTRHAQWSSWANDVASVSLGSNMIVQNCWLATASPWNALQCAGVTGLGFSALIVSGVYGIDDCRSTLQPASCPPLPGSAPECTVGATCNLDFGRGAPYCSYALGGPNSCASARTCGGVPYCKNGLCWTDAQPEACDFRDNDCDGRFDSSSSNCTEKTATGFVWPTGTSVIGNYAQWLADACAWSGNDTYYTDEYHIGWDFRGDLGDAVYAISDGDVRHISLNGWGTGNVGLLVEHASADGEPFVAIYGHLRTTLLEGDHVSAGQIIGTIGPWNPPHLHFGVRPGTSLASPYGIMTCPEIGPITDTNGFVDPVQWIQTTHPSNATSCAGMPNNSPCDDGNACTAIDTCSSGVCIGGQLRDCNDNNPCTTDICLPTSCSNEFRPAGFACGDASNTVCNHPDSCDGQGHCQPNYVTPGTLCDDGNACVVSERCDANGACTGVPRNCDDPLPCTVDSCNSTSGCVHTSIGSCSVDQSWEPRSGCGTGTWTILDYEPIGQEFTPTKAVLYGVDVLLENFNSGPPYQDVVTVTIREQSITGTTLASLSRSIVSSVPHGIIWQQFQFSPSVVLIPGNLYVLELAATDPTFGWRGAQNSASCPGYPGGSWIYWGTVRTNADVHFRTWAGN